MSTTVFRHLKRFPTYFTEATIDRRYAFLSNKSLLLLGQVSCIHSTHTKFIEKENPFKRTVKIFADDFKDLKNYLHKPHKYVKSYKFPTHCDVLIIGGGVMGLSIAYWLQERALDGLRIVVVEKDPSVNLNDNTINNKNDNYTIQYLKSTSALSVGGIRQQFSLKENIELSLYSAEFLRNIKHHLGIAGLESPNINFNPAGYLFLAPEKSAQLVMDNVNLQNSLGAKVELLTPEKLKEKFPWINTEGVAIASHGLENEGWFDPWSLLHAFKIKAVSLGVDYVQAELTGFGFNKNPGILNKDSFVSDGDSLKEAIVSLPDGSMKSITFGLCVIAAGAISGHVGKLAGLGTGNGLRSLPIPVEPRKRYVHLVNCPDGPGFNCPLLIDYTGAYFRREGIGGNYICGMSPPEEEEPSTDNLDVESCYFEEKVWPIIAHRVPAFEKCKVKSCWAGFYDFNAFDENAFVGPHPGYHNLYFATGFSGHGIQQSPAIGRAFMEMIIDGEFRTIDLTRLGFDRYLKDEPLWESNIV